MKDLKQIVFLGSNFWKKEAEKIKRWIITDTKAGIFQNGRGLKQYISETYKKYKANNMRRLTKGGKLKDFDPSQDYMGKRLYGTKQETKKGKRVSGLAGVPIKSNNISYVDMTLTGKLLDGLHTESFDDRGVTMSYNEADRGKIEGNRKFDREIVGLNEENIDKLKNDIIEQYSKNMSEVLGEDIVINIKLM